MQLGSIYLKDKEAAIPEVRRLLDTYKVVPGAMVPKKQVYDAYRAFCASCDFEPSDVSSFGKIFKRVFPDVERKRLVKGWHYNNLAPRANDTTPSSSSSTSTAGGTEDSSPAAAPGDRLYHSDPVVPTASSRGGARRHLTTRPLSPPPPRPHSRSASPVSGAATHFTTSFTAIPTPRSRSPSPSSAIVRRAHSQSPCRPISSIHCRSTTPHPQISSHLISIIINFHNIHLLHISSSINPAAS
ncbi:RFX DNAbinding domain containing protein [Acanthamoeba castellanii str. Neff]|uniref:RFX DNAbinding domain containing protein n=1 Tax=Acanthamoeba castellanii (strain ATCC 30010 / Neff) TaxID=1257118 RepID=L8GI94_ACACF|nr:RFX DNAbinding domain containing protein [Acanthamoeba castellanii str. Neff]ELR12687.1 RFX DNAbinding domain containing protein [Acanthamoeba castellanii str. Neff]